MLRRVNFLPLSIVFLAAFLSGCSFVRIQNVSDTSVTVLVTVPDAGGGSTRTIRPGTIVDVFSTHGGRYSVKIVPSEAYKTLLTDLQQTISHRLFRERESLTADEVAGLVERLNDIDKLIEDLAKPGASCSGQLPDFDTAVVVIVFDSSDADYSISCQ